MYMNTMSTPGALSDVVFKLHPTGSRPWSPVAYPSGENDLWVAFRVHVQYEGLRVYNIL